MKNYTNFAFLDGESLVVLERYGYYSEPVFGPVADAIRHTGTSRPSSQVAAIVFAMMSDDVESEWSLADTIRRNDRKVLVVDIRGDKVTLYDAVENDITEKIFSLGITEFTTKYGSR